MNRNTVLATTLSCLAAVISAEVKPRAFSTQPQYFGQGAARCPLSSLKAQGFSGPTGRGVTIKFLGNIPDPKGEYFAYGHYFINPDNNHGHQRILIMLRYCKYIGHYFAMAEPIRIRGNAIILEIIYLCDPNPLARANGRWYEGV